MSVVVEPAVVREADVFDSLPPDSFLKRYVTYAASQTDAHAGFHIIGGLMLLTQAVPSDYSLPFAARIYGNMYGLCVAGSSVGKKTTSLKIAKRVLQDGIQGCCMELPGSEEGFSEMLREKPKQVLFYEEFGDFLMKAKEGYGERLKGAFMACYDNSPLGRALAKSRRGAVENPRFSLIGAVATDILDTHTTGDDWTSGFMSRFFTVFGQRERLYKRQPLDDQSTRIALSAELKSIANNLKPLGKCLWLDDEAVELWENWYDYKEALCAKLPRELQSAYQRAEGFVQKICLLLAWDSGHARTGKDWHVTREHLEQALMMVDLHLQSVRLLDERLANTLDMRHRRAVLDAVTPGPAVTLGIITRRSRLLKRRVGELLDTLKEEGYISRVNSGGKEAYVRVEPTVARFELPEEADGFVPEEHYGESEPQ